MKVYVDIDCVDYNWLRCFYSFISMNNFSVIAMFDIGLEMRVKHTIYNIFKL